MEISLVMMLLMVKGKMRVTLLATPTSPMVSHKDSHTISTTYSIVTPSMTLVSPNNDPLNDFDESTSPNKFLYIHFGEILYLQRIGITIIMEFIIA